MGEDRLRIAQRVLFCWGRSSIVSPVISGRQNDPNSTLYEYDAGDKVLVKDKKNGRISANGLLGGKHMLQLEARKMTVEQTAENLTICTPSEMIDKLAPYAEAGVDRFIMNINFGVEQSEVLESIQCFAEEVMPHFRDEPMAQTG